MPIEQKSWMNPGKKKVAVVASFGVITIVIFLSVVVHGKPLAPWSLLIKVQSRSSACSLLDLPETYRSRSQRFRARSDVAAAAKLVKRDPVGFELWSTPDGLWWIPAGDIENLTLTLAEQRCDIYGTRGVTIRPGDIVLDCGAHIGTFTRKALKTGAKLVVAVEPAPENVECLRRNFAQEIASGRVIACAKGVWDRKDSLVLSSSGSAQHTIVDGTKGLTVPLTTIDALTQELQLGRVDFIKMDIEGSEERALVGAQRTLSAYRPRLAVAGYHNREDYQTIERVVRHAVASYGMERGPCYSARGMRPEALFFQ